jgi:MFS transporter, ACS family, glucarate transporter
MSDNVPGTVPTPTRARYWVIFFAVTLGILAYIDRVSMSQAAPVISRELGLSKTQMGSIFAAFGLAYALFEIPSGWLGDWLGPRSVLMRIVLWWSFFTAATGWMWSFTSLWVTRFLFGAGEAGCFPNLTKAFSVWLPQREKVRAQGIMWMAARWGGAFTPPLVVATFVYFNWRTAFLLYGFLGVVWAYFFFRWFRDNPRDHRSVNAAELALLEGSENLASGHADVPWGRLVTSGSVWLLWVQYFLISYSWYFYITWLPTYLQEARGLDAATSAKYAILPLLFGGFGNLVSGLISPVIAEKIGSVRVTRRLMGSLGFLGASVFMIGAARLGHPGWAMLMMGMASFCNDLVMPGAWAACMDIGGKYAGTVAGSMNMMGNLAGFVAPFAGGYIVQHSGGDWTMFLYTMVGSYLLGTLCWPFIDPVTSIERKHP